MSDDPLRAVFRRYATATEIDPAGAQRIRAAVHARPRRRWVWAPLALAAAAVIAWMRHDPPAALPLRDVSLAMEGQGTIGGTESSPRIRWEEGTLGVRVTPARGVHLAVETPEATVEVVGTVFTVARALDATTVDVSEGTVRWRCGDAAPEEVHAGASRQCLSSDPVRLLHRATEQFRAGAAATERLASADAGLARPADPLLRAELLAHRTGALQELGRVDEALASAEEALALGPSPRRAEMLSFVARTRYGRERCGALPALRRAAEELPPGPEVLLYASCLAESDPRAAAEALGAPERWSSSPLRERAEALRRSWEGR